MLAFGCGRLNKHSTDEGVDAGVTKADCESVFDSSVDLKCEFDTDCVLLTHPDCCGPIEIGVASVGLQQAETAESSFEPCETAQCGPVGCAHQVEAENGQAPGSGQSIVPVCQMNQCTSIVQ